MNLKAILGTIGIAVLFFFGIVFATASNYWPTGPFIAVLLFAVGLATAYFMTRKPAAMVQKLEVSGEMKANVLKCPNCGGSVNANQIKITSGVPFATCSYCGHTFEVTEEPKW
jgi:uncharacterized membrane protein